MKKQKSEVSSRKSADMADAAELSTGATRARSALSALLLSIAVFVSGSAHQTPRRVGVPLQQRPAVAATQQTQNIQDVVAKQTALVTEFDVNGLKVLIKRREGSLTVSAGLFLRGGVRNITAENAGGEAVMLAAATDATTRFPPDRMRNELLPQGTV